MTKERYRTTRKNLNNQTRLILDHLALLGAIAAKTTTGLSYGDKLGAGGIGLIQAAHRYTPAKGVPFASFAAIRIAGAIKDESRKWRRVDQRTVNPGQAFSMVSLDAPLGFGDKSATLHDVLADESFKRNVEEEVARRELRSMVFEECRLSLREKQVLWRVFWMGTDGKDIARRMGLHATRVSQYLRSGKAKVEKQLRRLEEENA